MENNTENKTITYFFPTESNPHVIPSYPYGSMRCVKKIWIEFKKGFGCRLVEQTQNPKTNRWNNPKKSTYVDLKVGFLDPETGYFKTSSWSYVRDGLERPAILYTSLTTTTEFTGREWEQRVNLAEILKTNPELADYVTNYCHKLGKRSDFIDKNITFEIVSTGHTEIL